MSLLASAPEASNPRWLRIGEWLVDADLDELRRDGQTIKLEPRKMQLLLALARKPGELVTTDELFDVVWKDVVVAPSSIYQSVAQLRRSLGDDSAEPRYIATVPRKGYRLVAAVTSVAAGPDAIAAAAAPTAPMLSAPLPAAQARASVLPWRRRVLVAVAAASATVAGGIGLWAWNRRPLAPEVTLRIVVLPFKDITPGGVEQPLAEGLSDEVTTVLASHPQLRVIARTSAVRAVGLTLAEAGSRLDVSHVLSGELYRTRDKVRVTARLVAVGDGRALWVEAIERPAAELGALPGLLAGGALRALRLAALSPTATAPAEAFELSLLGQHALRPLTVEAILKARDYFQRAIDLDPTYAPAYALLALTWVTEAQFGGRLYWRDAAARAQPLLDKALALDPDLARAHAVAGYLAAELLQPQTARRHLLRAVELAPGTAQAWFWLASATRQDGLLAQAREQYGRAAALDPLNFLPHALQGLMSIHIGRHDDAQRHYAQAVALAPDHPNSRWGAGILGYARGELDAAVQGYRRALAADTRRRDLWFELGWLYLDLGLATEAEAAFAQGAALSQVAAYGPLNAANALFLRDEAAQLPAYLRRHGLPSGQYGAVGIYCALLLAAVGRAREGRDWLSAGIAQQRGDPLPAYGDWDLCRGHFTPVNIAATLHAMGDAEGAAPFLAEATAFIDRAETRGYVWHAIHYERGRIHALRGESEPALAQIEHAVATGWRRSWWARVDPALATLRSAPRLAAALAQVDRTVAAQRARLRT